MSPGKVRGRPFKHGNPGRPPGSKNKATEMIEQLGEDAGARIVQTVVELAEEGNVACLRMLLDRIWPVRKGQPVDANMPPINNSQDVPLAITAIWTALRQGRITPDEASALSGVAER